MVLVLSLGLASMRAQNLTYDFTNNPGWFGATAWTPGPTGWTAGADATINTTSAKSITFNGSTTIGNLTVNGSSSPTLTDTASRNLTFSGGTINIISGAAALIFSGNTTLQGNFTKTGAGIVRLDNTGSAVSAYVGTATINAGRFEIGGTTSANVGANSNVIINSGAAFQLRNSQTYTLGAIVLNNGTFELSRVNTAGAISATVSSLSGSSGNITAVARTNSLGLSNATLTINQSTNTTFGGNITGFKSFTGANFTSEAYVILNKQGSGALTLNGAVDLRRQTTISAGTLEIGAAGLWGSGNHSAGITNNGTFITSGTSAQIFSGVISGTGALTQNGSGTLTLSGTNTYAGGTTINAGTIQIQNASSIGSSGNITLGGGTLKYGIGVTQDFSSRIKNSNSAIAVDTNGESIIFGSVLDSSNSGGFTKNGLGNLTLSSANTFTGNVTLNAGRLVLGNDSSLGGTTGSIVINSGTIDVTAARSLTGNKAQNWNGNFTFLGTETLNMGTGAVALGANSTITVSASTLTVGGNISGSGFGLGQNGAGSLILSGSNSYTGATTLNSGTVVFNGANALSSTTSLLNATSTTLSFQDGATRNSSVSGGLTLNNANFVFDLGGASADRLNFGGLASLSGNNVINLNFLSSASAGSFTLFTATGGLNSSWSLDPSVNQSGFTFTLDQSSATQLLLVVTSSATGTYWTGEASNNWSGVNFSTSANASATLSGASLNSNTDLIFAADSPSNLATVVSSNYTIGSLSVSTAGVSINGSYTITASKSGADTFVVNAASGTTTIGASLAGSGAGLTMSGGGMLVLNAANAYGGNTTLSSGTLAINNANAISSGVLTISGGSLDNTSGGPIILATNNSQKWNGDFGFTGTNDLDLGTGGVTLSATRTVTIAAGNLTVGGNIAATGSGLTKEGSGTLVLSGSNAYTGLTTINAGTLRISGGNAISDSSTVNLANTAGVGFEVNSSETIASLQGGGTSGGVVTVASGQTLSVAESGSQTFSGVIAGAGGMTLNGSGTMSLAGANTYTGGTTITAGTLSIGAGGATGSLSSSSAIVNNGVLVFNRSNTITQGTDFSSSAISGTGSLVKNGSNTLVLTAANSYAGTTTISAGTLQIGNGGTTGSLSTSSAITNNGSLVFNRSDTVTQGTNFSSTPISGSGSVVQNGTGTLVISTNSTYTGGTMLNAGTLQMQAAQALGTSGTITFGGGTLQWGNVTTDLSSRFSTAGNQSFKIDVTNLSFTPQFTTALNSAGGSLIKTGLGTLYLAPSTSTISSITINQGTIRGGNNTNTFGVNSTIFLNGGTLQLAAGDSNSGNYNHNNLFIQSNSTLLNRGATTSPETFYKFGNLTIGDNTLTATPLTTNAIAMSTTGLITITKATQLTGNATFNVVGTSNTLALESIEESGGSRSLTKTGNGTLTINGTGTYTGVTTISNGTLTLSGGNAIADTGSVSISTEGILNLGASETIGSLSGAGNVTLGSNTLTIGVTSGNTTFTGAISGTGDLVKDGAGALTLSGNSTYSGTTTISAGTIQIGHANALGAFGNISFSGGALQYGNGTITDLSARIKNSGAAILIDTNNNNVIFASVIDSSNTLGLTKNGTGTLALTASNTYTGATTVNAGTLTLNNGSAIADTSEVSIASGAVLNLGESETIGSLAGGGNVTIGSNTLTLGGNNTSATFSGVISGSGGLTKTGTGNLTLGGSNSYTGTTLVLEGTLALGASNVLADTGSLTINGGTFDISTHSDTVDVITMTNGSLIGTTGVLTGNTYNITGGNLTAQLGGGSIIINNGTTNIGTLGSAISLTVNGSSAVAALINNVTAASVSVQNGGSITGVYSLNATGGVTASSGSIASNLIGSGGLTMNGTGNTLTLSGSNTYTGATTLTAGTISLGTTAALGGTAGLNMANDTMLTYTGGTGTLGADITVTSGTGTIQNSGSGLLTLSGALSKNGTTLTLKGGSNGLTVSGAITGTAVNSDLILDGGSITLASANSYNGPTYLVNGTTLTASVTNALPTSNGLTAVTMDATGTGSSTLALGASQSIASLTGAASSNVTLGSSTLILGTTSGDTTFAGRIGGSGNLVKDGASTQILSGNNSFTGATTINSGTLQAASANALGSTSNVTISNGGSLLVTANDAIGTGTEVTLAGGTLAFGAAGYNGSVGALTLSANSILDLGTSNNGVLLRFGSINWSNANALLSIYNWTGTPLWEGGSGNNKDQIYFENSTLTDQQLQRISFYSGFGTGFSGNAFQINSGTFNREIIAVPEAETYKTIMVLMLFAGFWIWKQRRMTAAQG